MFHLIHYTTIYAVNLTKPVSHIPFRFFTSADFSFNFKLPNIKLRRICIVAYFYKQIEIYALQERKYVLSEKII